MKLLLVGKRDDIPFVRKCCICGFLEEIIWENPESVHALENKADADCVIVAMRERESAYEASRLISYMAGVPSERIIDFYAYFRQAVPLMAVKRVMDNPMKRNYTGMVLGLSHAQVGILPELMEGNFCNLAVSAQDLFYNLKTLQYCRKHHSEKIKDLKYLVVDMYNYNFFNFDTSLSRHAVNYLRWGGYSLDRHNFPQNPNLPGLDFEEEVKKAESEREKNVTREGVALWKKLFPDAHKEDGYRGFANPTKVYQRTKVFGNDYYDEDMGFRGTVKTVHGNTIKENEGYLQKIIELGYEINSDIKIYLVLIPRFYWSQVKARTYFKDWKEMFYSYMEKMKREYGIKFLDFKDSDMAKDIHNYYDESHLNYFGAIKFTKMLETRIIVDG